MTSPVRTRFHDAYETDAPWDIGHPQPAIVEVADRLPGAVLDVGCGTGEHALFFASRGQPAAGVDLVPLAIERACAKAVERGLEAEFVVGDVLDLGSLGRTFDAAVDSGCFHTMSDDDRPRFVASLAAALNAGGRYLLLGFSTRTPGEQGPRRLSEADIRRSFGEGWQVLGMDEVRFAVSSRWPEPPWGWRALIERR